MARGKFIVFEGGEYAGKTTQLEILAERLRKAGYSIVATKEPGGTRQGEEIRARLLGQRLAPGEELRLFIEDRRVHVAQVVAPALKEGKFVLCDRFSDSTRAYQHYGRGLSLEFINKLDAEARQGIAPDLVVLLDMSPEKAFERAPFRREPLTVFERERMDFHRKVRAGFLELARNDSGCHEVINANRSSSVIAQDIWKLVVRRIFH